LRRVAALAVIAPALMLLSLGIGYRPALKPFVHPPSALPAYMVGVMAVPTAALASKILMKGKHTLCFKASFSRVATVEQVAADIRVLEHVLRNLSRRGKVRVEYSNGQYVICVRSSRRIGYSEVKSLILSGTSTLIVRPIAAGVAGSGTCLVYAGEANFCKKLAETVTAIRCEKPFTVTLTASSAKLASECGLAGVSGPNDLSGIVAFEEKLYRLEKLARGYDCIVVFTSTLNGKLAEWCRNSGHKCIIVTDDSSSTGLLPHCTDNNRNI
jgi:hypothetical protein